MALLDRFKRVWNAFRNSTVEPSELAYGQTSSYGGISPARNRLRVTNERSIIASIYNQLGMDVADQVMRHVLVDPETKAYLGDVDSPLNDCLTFEPNLDQGPRAFRQDIAMTMFDKGVAAIVPVDANVDPDTNEIFDVLSVRVGEILAWYPQHVRVNLYRQETGQREEVVLSKNEVAIVENPLYSVMNEPNSTLQRLIRKLGLLDAVDEQSASGKLDIIIQLPYVIKSEARQQQAEKRREDIEFQLRGSQYGIAYIDGTEKITQLNRPAENNLLAQIEYLTNLLYNQLGLSEDVMNGTANEEALLNYFGRTIEPILDAIVEAMQRTFLRARGFKNNERVMYFRNPFKLVPVKEIAEIADKFTRNEILSSNELRGFMGIPPSKDPKADELRNANMPQQDAPVTVTNNGNGSRPKVTAA